MNESRIRDAEYLRGLGDGSIKIPSKANGVCVNLVLADREHPIEELANITNWPEFSGDRLYPVPSGLLGISAKAAYTAVYRDKWVGKYGDNRKRLCLWIYEQVVNNTNPPLPENARLLILALRRWATGQGLEEVERKGLCEAVARRSGLNILELVDVSYWPGYSGNPLYPVPAYVSGDTPLAAYEKAKSQRALWKGGYGENRRKLCIWVSDVLERNLGKPYEVPYWLPNSYWR